VVVVRAKITNWQVILFANLCKNNTTATKKQQAFPHKSEKIHCMKRTAAT
jgi:hypothetical protein